MKWIQYLILTLIIVSSHLFLSGIFQITMLCLAGLSLPFWWQNNPLSLLPSILILEILILTALSLQLTFDSEHLRLLAQNTSISSPLWLLMIGGLNLINTTLCLFLPYLIIKIWIRPQMQETRKINSSNALNLKPSNA
ncbi:hypothetical protein AAG747_27345 [Rapidithrix thailandica]|uniref:NADH dehydrogenase subunit 6 n=1 Tax=Rapidithrix thailandica TaxID=413964 RepID=A0AAW9SLN4_9BACT